MPNSDRTVPRIRNDVRNLCRDRFNYKIDDDQFKQGLQGILRKSNPQAVGLALAKGITKYLYLLTNNVDREIATWVRYEESNWAIAMEWGRGKLRNDEEIRSMLSECLHNPVNRTAFAQRVEDWIHEHEEQPNLKRYLREELIGAVLDFFFTLADVVTLRMRQGFKDYVRIKKSKQGFSDTTNGR